MEGEAMTAESKQVGSNLHWCAGQLYSLTNLWTVPKTEVFDLTGSAVELTSPPFQTPLNLMLKRGRDQVVSPPRNLTWQIALKKEGEFFSFSVRLGLQRI